MESTTSSRKRNQPKYRAVDRAQVAMRVMDVEKLIGEDHPARMIWTLVGRMDLSRFEEKILSEQDRVGRPCWPPQLLISVWVYGYSIGVASARALERMMEDESGLRWLSGDETVNHHTLSDFRVEHGAALNDLFAQVLAAMTQEGMLDLTTLFQDGTKIRAVSGKQSMRREVTLREHLEQARAAMAETERRAGEEGEAIDARRRAAQQRAVKERVARMQAAVKALAERQWQVPAGERVQVRVSESEPEARKMKHADGSWAPSYNVQVSTEPKSRVIVSVKATTDANDVQQLEAATERFFANTGQWPERVIADNGYASRNNVEAMSKREITLIAPWKGEASRQAGANKVNGRDASFSAECFRDGDDGGLICPVGQQLVAIGTRTHHGLLRDIYEASAENCLACPHRQTCCGTSQGPRRVERVRESVAMKSYLECMQQPATQQLYKLRCAVAEFPHLIMKARWNWRRFSVRGLVKANIEAMWVTLAYNFHRWILVKHAVAQC